MSDLAASPPPTLSYASIEGKGEIRSLTGLRGVAACLVMIYHFCGKQVGTGLLKSFLNHGYLWVDLFFALSGFVMAMTYASAFAGGFDNGRYGAFLIRRLARIYPLFFVLTIMTAVLQASGISHNGRLPHLWLTLVANLLLIHSWGLAPSIDSPAWSISAEWGAYLLFPWLACLALFRRWQRALIALVLAALVMVLVAFLPTSLIGEDPLDRIGQLNVFSYNTPLPLLRCLAGFYAGLVSYRVAGMLRAVPDRTIGRLAVLVAAMIVAAMAIWSSDLLCIALFPWIVVLLSRDVGPLAQVLSSRPIHLLGVWSYAIYLLHPRTVRLSAYAASLLTHDRAEARVAAVVIGCAVSVSLAGLAHALVERPGRMLVRRWTGRRAGHVSRYVIRPENAAGNGSLDEAVGAELSRG